MQHVHPLAYLLGIEGLALLRAFSGDFADRAFIEARLAEIRLLLGDEALANAGVDMEWVSTVEGYEIWSGTYDAPGNGAFPLEEPFVLRIVDSWTNRTVLDAACGTGRYAEHLAARGHNVIGVDSSPDMLERARGRVPAADFQLGTLDRLPLDNGSVDAAVCSLALTHVRDLAPVMAELARVLRPGGDLVLSNMHSDAVLLGSIPRVERRDGQPGRIETWRYLTGDYLRAALPCGFRALACEEPTLPRNWPMPAAGPTDTALPAGHWRDWPWNLNDLFPQAAWAVNVGRPATVIWHFRLESE